MPAKDSQTAAMKKRRLAERNQFSKSHDPSRRDYR